MSRAFLKAYYAPDPLEAIKDLDFTFYADESPKIREFSRRYPRAAKKRRNLKKWANRYPIWSQIVTFQPGPDLDI